MKPTRIGTWARNVQACLIFFGAVAVATGVAPSVLAASAVLRSDAIAIRISASGELQEIQNALTGESYRIADDSFAVVTDRGALSNASVVAASREIKADSARYAFSSGGRFDVTLEYSLIPGHPYLRRRVSLSNVQVPLTLLKIELGRTVFENPPRESIKYDTFWNAPTVSFLRWEKGGVFTGIENPFFETSWQASEVAFSFEPAMRLKAGATYEAEPQFIGVYKKSGRMVRDQLPLSRLAQDGVYRPRFRNPSGHVALDWNEIRAMRDFAAEYLRVPVDKFLYILYCFWNPMPQIVSTEADEQAYYRMIDSFHELGGDLIIFNPLFKAQVPTADPKSYWTLAPEGTIPERILKHAADKGIKYGFYIGVAAQMEHGNAAAVIPAGPWGDGPPERSPRFEDGFAHATIAA